MAVFLTDADQGTMDNPEVRRQLFTRLVEGDVYVGLVADTFVVGTIEEMAETFPDTVENLTPVASYVDYLPAIGVFAVCGN